MAKHLPKKARLELAVTLTEEETSIAKATLVSRIKEGLEEVKRYKAGELELKSARAFLDEL